MNTRYKITITQDKYNHILKVGTVQFPIFIDNLENYSRSDLTFDLVKNLDDSTTIKEVKELVLEVEEAIIQCKNN